MIKTAIQDALREVLQELGISDIEPVIERPSDLKNGDYSTNIALIAAKKAGKNPRELAEEIVTKLQVTSPKLQVFERIETAGAGFINFWISKEELIKGIGRVAKGDEEQDKVIKGKKIMVEFAHPNTHKSLHIGHLRNLSIGESLVRIFEYTGIGVIRANYQGDVGMHIAKAMYGLLNLSPFKEELSSITGVQARVDFLGKAYAAGSQAYESDPLAKEKIHDYNYLIYASAQRFQEEQGAQAGTTDYLQFVKGRKAELDIVYKVWKETRQWSLDYYETMYKVLGTHFDRYYFESECLIGVDMAREAVVDGVLKESEGAIIFDGKPFGLDTRVFVNSLGLPTYEAKELALSKKELSEFGKLDQIIHVVGPEQASFFQITFKSEELLGIQINQQFHLAYGWVRLRQGKMSSRLGNVVTADQLISEVKKVIGVILEKSDTKHADENTATQIAVAAIKYSFLKVSTTQEIAFDLLDSVSAEGNSGPYLQYTFARTQSVLRKAEGEGLWAKGREQKEDMNSTLYALRSTLEDEEILLLRILYFFDETVIEAADKYSPNIIANYLYTLAQSFNLFYQKQPILKADQEEMRTFRLALTKSVGDTIKKGLYLLGIETPERM
ncbi:MAG TPA: arginine--tRNA ligase [Acinetobacter johnsonii]|nr:arginine--tRNA ligase [Acinetobacter johnsonii]